MMFAGRTWRSHLQLEGEGRAAESKLLHTCSGSAAAVLDCQIASQAAGASGMQDTRLQANIARAVCIRHPQRPRAR